MAWFFRPSVPASPGPGSQKRLPVPGTGLVLAALASPCRECWECAVHGGYEASLSPPPSPPCPLLKEARLFKISHYTLPSPLHALLRTAKGSGRTPRLKQPVILNLGASRSHMAAFFKTERRQRNVTDLVIIPGVLIS